MRDSANSLETPVGATMLKSSFRTPSQWPRNRFLMATAIARSLANEKGMYLSPEERAELKEMMAKNIIKVSVTVSRSLSLESLAVSSEHNTPAHMVSFPQQSADMMSNHPRNSMHTYSHAACTA